MIKLDRAAIADVTRDNRGFRAYTAGLEKRAVHDGPKMARTKGLHRRTGRYDGGFRAVFRPRNSRVVLGVLILENEVEYADIIEGGTKRPYYGKPLMFFFSRRHGHVISIRKHPGLAPKWVVRDTLRQFAKTKVTL